MKIIASVLQDHYTAHPTSPEESCDADELRRQCEAYKESSLQPQLDLARQAVQAGAQLILFREDCNGAGNLAAMRLDRPDLFETLAEPIPGPTSERIGEIARAGNCYIVTCFIEKQDGKIYNTALILNPQGKVIGKYHKVQLPPVERLMITPGSDLPVFSTDLGRIGMLICYDMMRKEVARCLAVEGGDI